jgi:ribosomal protein S12 methylthiotransferase accessory factor
MPPIGLLGEGRLYEALKQGLMNTYCLLELQRETLSSQVDQCQLVLVCHDSWSSALRKETHMLGQMPQVRWLPIYSEFDTVFLGPCTQPGVPGCFACSEHRRLCAIEDNELLLSLHERLEQENWQISQPPHSWGLQVLLPFIESEIAALLESTGKAKTVRAVLQLKLSALKWKQHRFLPDPSCTLCGNLPPDSQEAANIELRVRKKLDPTTFRTRSLSELTQQMSETYLDEEFGLIHRIGKRPWATCAITSAHARVASGSRRREFVGVGRTLNYKQSHLAAIAEALERYGGQIPQAKRAVVNASFRQLGALALDPSTLGLHTPEQYAQPDFRYVPYHHDLVYNWVWGYSFGLQRPILVPEFYPYYGYPEKQAFVYEISNGCALGSSLEEAILYALLEVLERDAFLLTWYARLGVPQIDCSSIPSQRIRWLIEHLEYMSGYTVSIYDTTLLHGAPCCWVMGVDEGQRPGFPRMVCTGGSHVLPEEAILGALLELVQMLQPEGLRERFQRGEKDALEMLRDPLLVREMEDHSTLYLLPEAYAHLDFLSQTPRQQTFHEAFAHLLQPALSLDLTEDLTRLVAHYWAQGTDTIVVDQTTPEHRELGFSCVKVIMPGMLPMTFGQANRRVHGFKRLAEWPMLMGYRATPLADEEVNPYPHPFP